MARSKKPTKPKAIKPPKPKGSRGGASVQDSAREILLAQIFGLKRRQDEEGKEKRQGIDATDEPWNPHVRNPYELKSTTTDQCGSARDFSRKTIEKWSGQYLIIGFGVNKDSGYEFEFIYVLHPDDLKGWFTRRRKKMDAADEETLIDIEYMAAGGAPFERISRAIDRFDKASLENNPKISLAYCRRNGTLLEPSRESLEAFVTARPLQAPAVRKPRAGIVRLIAARAAPEA